MTDIIDIPADNQVSTVPADPGSHPAVIWLVALVTIGVLFGFGLVTYSILSKDIGVDPATKGAVIQTWNNLAVAAAAVWTTSSVVNRLKGNK